MLPTAAADAATALRDRRAIPSRRFSADRGCQSWRSSDDGVAVGRWVERSVRAWLLQLRPSPPRTSPTGGFTGLQTVSAAKRRRDSDHRIDRTSVNTLSGNSCWQLSKNSMNLTAHQLAQEVRIIWQLRKWFINISNDQLNTPTHQRYLKRQSCKETAWSFTRPTSNNSCGVNFTYGIT